MLQVLSLSLLTMPTEVAYTSVIDLSYATGSLSFFLSSSSPHYSNVKKRLVLFALRPQRP